MKKTIKRIIKKLLPEKLVDAIHLALNYDDYFILNRNQLTYAQDLLYTYNNADFMKDSLFLEAYDLGKNTDGGLLLKNTGIHWRIHVLCWAANYAKNLEGDFVDCGVYTGIFARSVTHYINFETLNKKYYLLDTFSGLDHRYSSKYELKRNEGAIYAKNSRIYEQVKETFNHLNFQIIKGAVPETLSQVDSEKIAYLSIDMNCVQPEIAALEFFWDKLVKGGVIILDDYGYPSYEPQKAAHDEFAKSKGVSVLSLPTCQGIIVKNY